jgi:lipoprotein-anchoring transpeptidase ErfK/SrfK
MTISRRGMLILPFMLGGCNTYLAAPTLRRPRPRPLGGDYEEMEDNGYFVPAVYTDEIDPTYLRQEVAYAGRERPGSVVIDPGSRFLYLVADGGRATRYGVGVGREGFGWSGVASIRRKSAWASWTPPSQMIQRLPELQEYATGMPGGTDNPLGARAMYLYQGDRDTLYRIHGTNEPESIGKAVSSGCIRLINQDVIDLYNRVAVGTRVVVLASG